MNEVEARRMLKAFGTQVTQFMDRRRELKNLAADAIKGQDRTADAAVFGCGAAPRAAIASAVRRKILQLRSRAHSSKI